MINENKTWNEIKDFITVIVPVYNAVNTISKCIDSLLFLEKKGVRIIISDNNSNDGTQNILSKYQDYKNIEIYFQSSNIGGRSVQFLANKVQTKFLIPIGSDDYLIDCTKLDFTINRILKNPNTVGCNFNSSFIYEDFLVSDKTNIEITGSAENKFYKFFLHVGANSRYYGIIRSDLFKHLYPRENYFGDDVVLSARILSMGDWFYDENIILHRERGGSSNPLLINKANNFIFIPPFRLFKELFRSCPKLSLKVIFALLIYYIKILLGPLKHILIGR